MKNLKEKQKRGMKRDWILLGIILIIAVVLLSIFPDRKEPVINTLWDYFIEMALILPAVMVILGLFAVFVSKETVIKYLGKASGIKGIFLAIILGALPTGPLYVAFPMAASLLKKGAKISNIVVFLSAWACIKIPQELVELQFLGIWFMLSRLTLTIIFIVIMGIFIEKVVEWSEDGKNIKSSGGV
ncbi:MAG: permease [Archaeoglobaceae archaeon]|nr:permease [Archaeoglobaceae archaeon]